MSADLAWLEREDLWRPTTASWLDDPTYRDDIETALLSFADNHRYRFNKMFMSPRLVDRLYLGKLAAEIEDTLSELQLAKLGRPGFLVVHRDVQTLILAVTAKYLAACHSDPTSRLLPVTDVALSADHAFLPTANTLLVDRCIEMSLTGLLPTPGEDVSLEDVVDFRRRHDVEVRAFRDALREMVAEVSTSEAPLEVIRTFRDRVEDATAGLSDAARRRRIALRGGAAAVLVASVGSATLLEPSTVHWAFDGLGTAAGLALVERQARRTQARGDLGAFSYLYNAVETFSH